MIYDIYDYVAINLIVIFHSYINQNMTYHKVRLSR